MDLSPATLDWLRQSLHDGNALAWEIERAGGPAAGTVRAVVPPGFPASGLNQPERGQGMVTRRPADLAVAEMIGAVAPWLAVVEAPLMRPTDRVFARWARESFVFDAEVYHWLHFQGADINEIGEFFNRWASYPLNAVVVASSRTYAPAEKSRQKKSIAWPSRPSSSSSAPTTTKAISFGGGAYRRSSFAQPDHR